MAPLKCQLCPNSLSTLQRLIGHVQAKHGFNASQAKANVNKWLADDLIAKPAIEKTEECPFCHEFFSDKWYQGHLKSCAPKHNEPVPASKAKVKAQAKAAQSSTDGAAAAQPVDVAAEPAVANEVALKRAAFHEFLCKQGKAKRTIDGHMSIFGELVDFCEGDTRVEMMEFKLCEFMKLKPNLSTKERVYNTYAQYVSFDHENQGFEGLPFLNLVLVGGELVPAEESKTFHSRPRAVSSTKQKGSQQKERGQRVSTQPQVFDFSPTAVAQHQSTSSAKDMVTICGQHVSDPGVHYCHSPRPKGPESSTMETNPLIRSPALIKLTKRNEPYRVYQTPLKGPGPQFQYEICPSTGKAKWAGMQDIPSDEDSD